MMAEDLEHIKTFLNECNSLLTTLVALSRDTQTPRQTTTQTYTSKHSSAKMTAPSKPNRKKKRGLAFHQKKTKNIKNIKTQNISHNNKMNFKRLFKFLENPTKKDSKKPMLGLKTPLYKGLSPKPDDAGIKSFTSPSVKENLDSLDTPSPTQWPLHQDPWTDVLEGAYPLQNSLSSVPLQRWNLVLNRSKLVFENYPKPRGYIHSSQRKLHLLSIMNKAMTTPLKIRDIIQVEYLYYNNFRARAVVSLHHRSTRRSARSAMGGTSSKATVRSNLESLKAAMEQGNLSDLANQIHHELDLLENTTLDIAITGGSGAGKSSIVNALRGMKDEEEGSSQTGVTQSTMKPIGYPHPIFPKVTMWDLPGIGTPQFKAKEYVKDMNFNKYDFFIIVAAERFTENDADLACEIQKMNKNFFYVRTKVDVSMDAERRKTNFSEAKTLKEIRDYCFVNLKKLGESSPRVFLISRWDLNIYDFPLLQDNLENELNDLKRYALILALPSYSSEILKKKKALMEVYAWKLAIVPCYFGAQRLPLLSIICNVFTLLEAIKLFQKVFGLDEVSLRRLANWVGKPIDMLRSTIKNTPTDNETTTEWLISLFPDILCTIPSVIEEALGFDPMSRSLTTEEYSFLATLILLKNVLASVEEDAANVWAKAAECEKSQRKTQGTQQGEGEIPRELLHTLERESESTTMAKMMENSKIADVLSTLLEAPDKIKLDIAITGKSGAGKSALVNALRGLSDDEEGAAKTGVQQTTMEVAAYQHPKHPSVTIWDLPGIGTPEFKAATYLWQVNFERYDFFIIVSWRRLCSSDILLAKGIKQLGKKFYFVHTKIDMVLEGVKRGRSHYFDEGSVLQEIRDACIQKLEEEKFASQEVFLLSRYDLNKYDFHLLEETLEKDLPAHKQRAFVLALPTISAQILQKKKMILKKHAWEVATASCGVTATPTASLPFPCDVSILLPSMLNYYQEFGLDDNSLSRLARLVDQPEAQLKAEMKSPLASMLPNHVSRLLTEAQGGFFSRIVSHLLLPIGSPAAGRLAFTTTLRMLERFVDNLEDDAERVLNRAIRRKST
ncbi:uncharacterized protein LOC133370863 [Rhineura floridana]|uniref:uncharacterized protein LOC133370863 n=1 Tax=Rhineura floridana TaxID=261503 RepID=UPI002AC7FBDF|nr:uncharacterized protein LOC133370863 [Rhineura floridana]